MPTILGRGEGGPMKIHHVTDQSTDPATQERADSRHP